jgi:hypothetical protein
MAELRADGKVLIPAREDAGGAYQAESREPHLAYNDKPTGEFIRKALKLEGLYNTSSCKCGSGVVL